MPWEELPQPTRADVSEMEQRWKKKAQFLVDESLDQGLVQVLRQLGWNALGVDDEGLRGLADETVFARARDQGRLLLSKDRDFLNERRFPLTMGGAVAVLPEGPIDGEGVVRALRALLGIFAPLSRAYTCARMDLTSRDELQIRSFDPSKSFLQTQRYKLGPGEKTFIWQD